MVFQLRTYAIKPGTMDNWLVLFHEKVVPMHAKYGIPVRAAWVDRAGSSFVWVREFVGEGSADEQEQRYRTSDERSRVIGDEPANFIEGMHVREVEPAYPAPHDNV